MRKLSQILTEEKKAVAAVQGHSAESDELETRVNNMRQNTI